MKPIVKWQGGKSQLLDEIHKRIPEDIKRIIEPFVGGGAVFLDYEKPAVINDVNTGLIEVYKQGGAHTAAIDNLIGIKYASMPLKQFNSKSLMEQQMEDIIDNFKSPNGTILGNKIEINGKKYKALQIWKMQKLV